MAVDMSRVKAFPTRLYHPVYGEKEFKDANEVFGLSPDWFNTGEEADAHRTDTEAGIVVYQNQMAKHAAINAEGGPGAVRNSNQADQAARTLNGEPL